MAGGFFVALLWQVQTRLPRYAFVALKCYSPLALFLGSFLFFMCLQILAESLLETNLH